MLAWISTKYHSSLHLKYRSGYQLLHLLSITNWTRKMNFDFRKFLWTYCGFFSWEFHCPSSQVYFEHSSIATGYNSSRYSIFLSSSYLNCYLNVDSYWMWNHSDFAFFSFLYFQEIVSLVFDRLKFRIFSSYRWQNVTLYNYF